MASANAPAKRKAAGRTTDNEDHMVNAENAFHDAFYTDSSSSDSDVPLALTSRGQLRKKPGRRPKRPRLAAPVVPPISDDDLEEPVPGQGKPIKGGDVVQFMKTIDGPQLTINLADVIAKTDVSVQSLLHLSGAQIIGAPRKPSRKRPSADKTLTDLPVELCVKIYRNLFTTPDHPIMFTERRDFARSSQVLRVCRKVYEVGTVVLYGENSFHFTRAHRNRGTYFEELWEEVGYKDVRRFLTDIGPHNMAKLKYVSFELEDALPSLTTLGHEGGKYFNDVVLMEVISMLARHSVLERFAIGFRGKMTLTSKHYFLMKALCSIRCYQFSSDTVHGLARVNQQAFDEIKRLTELPRDNQGEKKGHQPKMFKDVRRPMSG